MSRREELDGILSSIDGALADAELPDAMRWSPEPETVRDAPAPFDGELVWQPPQRYESIEYRPRYIAEVAERLEAIRGLVRIEAVDWCTTEPEWPVLPMPARRHLEQQIRATLEVPNSPIVWTSTASDPLGDVLRARSRVIDRAQRRGPTADLLIFDEAYRVDPAYREEVRARTREEAQRIFRSIGEWFDQVAETFSSVAQEIGKGLNEVVAQWRVGVLAAQRNEGNLPPPASLRESDPRAYALQLRQSRGTGPDRQRQHQHRPRRH